MGTLILGGPVTSAFTHFALYGLAGIVEDRFGPVVTLQWSEAQEPVCSVTVPGTSTEEMARAVLEAATPEGARNWSSIQLEYSSKAKASPFAPGSKPLTPTGTAKTGTGTRTPGTGRSIRCWRRATSTSSGSLVHSVKLRTGMSPTTPGNQIAGRPVGR